jgi:hypothetical protein
VVVLAALGVAVLLRMNADAAVASRSSRLVQKADVGDW